ncbi:hypothetical protein CDAR_561261 [Caerostris darwini]|uniref:Uncharacterized protein n=1 Tax=Caerostris darwini TaxID=1538125 RepID=A0AAV4SRR1_9ARAC|nr:hypothetical protein CDAR_561261 [Caerostris darwini]
MLEDDDETEGSSNVLSPKDFGNHILRVNTFMVIPTNNLQLLVITRFFKKNINWSKDIDDQISEECEKLPGLVRLKENNFTTQYLKKNFDKDYSLLCIPNTLHMDEFQKCLHDIVIKAVSEPKNREIFGNILIINSDEAVKSNEKSDEKVENNSENFLNHQISKKNSAILNCCVKKIKKKYVSLSMVKKMKKHKRHKMHTIQNKVFQSLSKRILSKSINDSDTVLPFPTNDFDVIDYSPKPEKYATVEKIPLSNNSPAKSFPILSPINVEKSVKIDKQIEKHCDEFFHIIESDNESSLNSDKDKNENTYEVLDCMEKKIKKKSEKYDADMVCNSPFQNLQISAREKNKDSDTIFPFTTTNSYGNHYSPKPEKVSFSNNSAEKNIPILSPSDVEKSEKTDDNIKEKLEECLNMIESDNESTLKSDKEKGKNKDEVLEYMEKKRHKCETDMACNSPFQNLHQISTREKNKDSDTILSFTASNSHVNHYSPKPGKCAAVEKVSFSNNGAAKNIPILSPNDVEKSEKMDDNIKEKLEECLNMIESDNESILNSDKEKGKNKDEVLEHMEKKIKKKSQKYETDMACKSPFQNLLQSSAREKNKESDTVLSFTTTNSHVNDYSPKPEKYAAVEKVSLSNSGAAKNILILNPNDAEKSEKMEDNIKEKLEECLNMIVSDNESSLNSDKRKGRNKDEVLEYKEKKIKKKGHKYKIDMAYNSYFQNLHQSSAREKNKESDIAFDASTVNSHDYYFQETENCEKIRKVCFSDSSNCEAENILFSNSKDFGELAEKIHEMIKDKSLNHQANEKNNDSSLNSGGNKSENKVEGPELKEEKAKEKCKIYKVHVDNKNSFQNLHQNSTNDSNTNSSFQNLHQNSTNDSDTNNFFQNLHQNSTNDSGTNNSFQNLHQNDSRTDNSFQNLHQNSTNDSDTGNSFQNLHQNSTNDNDNSFQNFYQNSTNDSDTDDSFQNLHQNSTNDSDTGNSFQNLHQNSTNDNSFQNYHQNSTNYSDSNNSFQNLHQNSIDDSDTGNSFQDLHEKDSDTVNSFQNLHQNSTNDNDNSFQNFHQNSTNDSDTNNSFQNLHEKDSDTVNSFHNLHQNSTNDNDNSFQNFHQNITNDSDSAFLSSAINFNNYYFKKLEKRGAIEMSCPDSNNFEAKNILPSNSHDSILEKMYKKVKYKSEKFLRHQVNENKCDTVLTSYKDKPLALLDKKREKRQCKYKTHTYQNDLFQRLFENSDEEKIKDSDIVFHFSTIKSQENEHKPENSQVIKDVSCLESKNCEAKNILPSNSHDSILEKMYKKVKCKSEKFLSHQVNEKECDTVLTSYKDKPLALLDKKREKRQCKYKTHTYQNDLFQSLFENSDEEKIKDSDIVFHFSTIKSQENEHKPENRQAVKDVSCPNFNNYESGESAVELEKIKHKSETFLNLQITERENYSCLNYDKNPFFQHFYKSSGEEIIKDSDTFFSPTKNSHNNQSSFMENVACPDSDNFTAENILFSKPYEPGKAANIEKEVKDKYKNFFTHQTHEEFIDSGFSYNMRKKDVKNRMLESKDKKRKKNHRNHKHTAQIDSPQNLKRSAEEMFKDNDSAFPSLLNIFRKDDNDSHKPENYEAAVKESCPDSNCTGKDSLFLNLYEVRESSKKMDEKINEKSKKLVNHINNEEFTDSVLSSNIKKNGNDDKVPEYKKEKKTHQRHKIDMSQSNPFFNIGNSNALGKKINDSDILFSNSFNSHEDDCNSLKPMNFTTVKKVSNSVAKNNSCLILNETIEYGEKVNNSAKFVNRQVSEVHRDLILKNYQQKNQNKICSRERKATTDQIEYVVLKTNHTDQLLSSEQKPEKGSIRLKLKKIKKDYSLSNSHLRKNENEYTVSEYSDSKMKKKHHVKKSPQVGVLK